MKGTRTINQLHLIFFLVFFFQFSFAQLSSFSLVVTKTDETCTGNGSLSFNVQNTTPGATIVYSIYLLPNVTTPIATTSNTTFTGLQSGNYTVIATQTLGNLSNTAQQSIQINDTRVLLTYQVTSLQTSCAIGTIVATVLTGNPVTYEITSGPVIRPPQTSNLFTGLGPGTYNIRVNDACGEGVVQTYTLSFTNPPNLTLGNFIKTCALNTCNTISGTFLVTADLNTSIRYPLTIQTTTFPPSGGAPIIQSQTLSSGSSSSQLVSLIVPFFHAQNYTFNIQVTDACGNIYTNNAIPIFGQLSANSQQLYANCITGIEVSLCDFLPPYTTSFISAPAGFNPTLFNSNHPGPFNSSVLVYSSNSINDLPVGNYTIQIVDACGRTVQTQVSIVAVLPGFEVLPVPDSCAGEAIVRIPNGGPLVTSVIMTSGPSTINQTFPYNVSFNINSGVFTMQLPSGTYNFTGTDVCGNSFQYEIIILPRVVSMTASGNSFPGCTSNDGIITVTSAGGTISSIRITSAPTALNQTLPYLVPLANPNSMYVQITNLPVGNYTLAVTDNCNQVYTLTATISNVVSNDPLVLLDRKGCGVGFDSIGLISPNGPLQVVTIIAAPSTFSFPLPYNVSFNIAANGIFYMNSLPEGTYTFYSKDICNVERTETRLLIGYHTTTEDIQVVSNCGSFDLVLNYNDNSAYLSQFWLQKYNSITGQWVHPTTGVVYPTNSMPTSSNSINLINNTTNLNIAATGQFRILKTYEYFSNGSPSLLKCIENIRSFEYNGGLQITTAYALPCVNQGTQIIIVANGIPPLTYRITSKDGLPFLVNNGNSNIFSGLQPGIYNFQVQDTCGNIVNRLFDITTLPEPSITASNLCQGQSGELSVQAFSFLNYQWWKGTNSTTILSTTNVLTFNPFNGVTDAGTYYVRIYSTIPGSCVDRILSYTIPLSTIPNAGLDGNLVLCGTSNSVNLFTLLNGTYDTGGVWQEITNSGMLSGNNWLPLGIPYGVYNFKYTVSGFCNAIDESFVSITFNPIPMDPIVDVDSNYCSGDDIQFFTETIPNATYQWTGPNGFTATTQNLVFNDSTTILSGNYTVTANLNGCTSSTTKTILVKPIPQFAIEDNCINNNFTITAIPANGTFSSSDTFLWSGPDGFTSTINPIQISNKPKGIYSVVITNIDGCSTTQSIEVLSTLCTIPNGISPNGDGLNDSFDLSGFTGIREIKIFNRYGMVVYEQENYIDQWHGQQKNSDKLLPDGTYYYLINFENSEPKTGWVYLVREY